LLFIVKIPLEHEETYFIHHQHINLLQKKWD
jgi:hypothetical protein